MCYIRDILWCCIQTNDTKKRNPNRIKGKWCYMWVCYMFFSSTLCSHNEKWRQQRERETLYTTHQDDYYWWGLWKKVNHGREMVFKIAFFEYVCMCVFFGMVNHSYEHSFYIYTKKFECLFVCHFFWAQSVLSSQIEIKSPFDPIDKMHFVNFCILHMICTPFFTPDLHKKIRKILVLRSY